MEHPPQLSWQLKLLTALIALAAIGLCLLPLRFMEVLDTPAGTVYNLTITNPTVMVAGQALRDELAQPCPTYNVFYFFSVPQFFRTQETYIFSPCQGTVTTRSREKVIFQLP